MVVAALGVTLISFIVSHAVPADPIVSNLGQIASQRPEIVKAFREKWGLDRPLYQQYLTFLRNLTRGELGNSINTRRAVTKDLALFMPATVELARQAMTHLRQNMLFVGLPNWLGLLLSVTNAIGPVRGTVLNNGSVILAALNDLRPELRQEPVIELHPLN